MDQPSIFFGAIIIVLSTIIRAQMNVNNKKIKFIQGINYYYSGSNKRYQTYVLFLSDTELKEG